MKFYISGALMASKNLNEATKEYEDIAALLEENGHDAYLPHKNTHPAKSQNLQAHEVFGCDYSEIEKADAVLAFANEPSLGVGAEVALALNLEKTVIVAFRTDTPVSRFLTGLVEQRGGTLISYEALDNLQKQVENSICITK